MLPGERRVIRQQPGSGRSTVEGPSGRGSPVVTTVSVPTSCAVIVTSPVPPPGICRQTHNTLLETSSRGGDQSRPPNRTATTFPLRLRTNGTTGSGSLKPVRAHSGRTCDRGVPSQAGAVVVLTAGRGPRAPRTCWTIVS